MSSPGTKKRKSSLRKSSKLAFSESSREPELSDANLTPLGQASPIELDGTPTEARLFDDSFVSSLNGGEVSDVEEDLDCVDPSEVLEYKVISKDRVVLGLKRDAEIFFKGCLQIKVLKGEISTQGYRIGPQDQYSSIYSPRGHSLLSISATNNTNSVDDFESRLTSEGVSEADLPDSDVICITKKLSEPWMDYLKRSLKKSDKINLFGRDATPKDDDTRWSGLELCLDVTLYRPKVMQTKLWRQGEEWDLALTNISIVRGGGGQPRLVATGGKGVGKSSFARWMTNCLIQETGEVLFLDLDPGQKEFGLPGYLTLALLDKPLLGPNFCHQQTKWEKSIYFGDINISNNPGRYISCVSELLTISDEFSGPMVVNTMGWCQGLGALINTDVIRLCQPTTVVQLLSRFPKKNYPRSLSSDYVSTTNSSWRKSPRNLSYTLLEFQAVPERRWAKDMRSQDSWGIPEPKVLRDIQMLSWFGKRGGIRDLPVYSIHFSKVCLSVSHERVPAHALLAALAFNPVDLCVAKQSAIRRPKQSEAYSILNTSPVTESIGTGIVRGVDKDRRLIYVATDVEEEMLKQVNCLVGGSLCLPSGLLSKQKVPSPYLDPEPSDNPLDLPWQRNKKYGQFSH